MNITDLPELTAPCYHVLQRDVSTGQFAVVAQVKRAAPDEELFKSAWNLARARWGEPVLVARPAQNGHGVQVWTSQEGPPQLLAPALPPAREPPPPPQTEPPPARYHREPLPTRSEVALRVLQSFAISDRVSWTEYVTAIEHAFVWADEFLRYAREGKK